MKKDLSSYVNWIKLIKKKNTQIFHMFRIVNDSMTHNTYLKVVHVANII